MNVITHDHIQIPEQLSVVTFDYKTLAQRTTPRTNQHRHARVCAMYENGRTFPDSSSRPTTSTMRDQSDLYAWGSWIHSYTATSSTDWGVDTRDVTLVAMTYDWAIAQRYQRDISHFLKKFSSKHHELISSPRIQIKVQGTRERGQANWTTSKSVFEESIRGMSTDIGIRGLVLTYHYLSVFLQSVPIP